MRERKLFCCADLMNTLWEADVVVFKAHITTGPGGKVLDMFWIYDNRCELPENHRSDVPRHCAGMALKTSEHAPVAAWRLSMWPRDHSSPVLDMV